MKTVGISTFEKSSGLLRMLNALGDVLNLHFENRTFGDDTGVDAWIFPEASHETLRRITYINRPCYVVIAENQRIPCGESSTIDFASHYSLPPVLSKRKIRTEDATKVMALPKQAGNMTVLASKAGAPVWKIQEVEGQKHHYVALPIPELNEEESLFQHFNGDQFLQLLPFLLFLLSLTEGRRWDHPHLQACFMFDDPNLHWPTYGFIDFAQIARHAQMHNYHVCFATIPQDAWFVHKPTALLFQEYSDQLSLLIHGNDHIARELAIPCSDDERTRNLRQALKRIRVFEQRSGVEVAKVMVPPHGACSESTLAEMARLGFEAACISNGSLRRYNGEAAWVRTLGMRPSDIIGGMPVFPRFPLSENSQNNILVAALLHQPILVRGHHQDLAEGLRLLADVSEFVNSLGTVRWTSMERIARSHFARMVDKSILRVRMFTKRIEICVPEGIDQVQLERMWLKEIEDIPLAWRLMGESSQWNMLRPDSLITVLPGQKLEIISGAETPFFIDSTNDFKLRPWPAVRRQLTEARDRMAPLLRRVSTFWSNQQRLKQ